MIKGVTSFSFSTLPLLKSLLEVQIFFVLRFRKNNRQGNVYYYWRNDELVAFFFIFNHLVIQLQMGGFDINSLLPLTIAILHHCSHCLSKDTTSITSFSPHCNGTWQTIGGGGIASFQSSAAAFLNAKVKKIVTLSIGTISCFQGCNFQGLPYLNKQQQQGDHKKECNRSTPLSHGKWAENLSPPSLPSLGFSSVTWTSFRDTDIHIYARLRG